MIKKVILCLIAVGLLCTPLANAYTEEILYSAPDDLTSALEPEFIIEPDADASLLITPAPVDNKLTMYIDGVQFGISPYLRDGVTYVPLRDFCTAIDAGTEVSWNGDTQTVKVATPPLTFTLNIAEPYIIANGRYLYIPGGARLYEGKVYVPVRILAKAFGAEVTWNKEFNIINVVSSGTQIVSGDEFYDEDSLYWLSRIISAEARGESLEGQIAVGNVVLNRVAYKGYPDTIYGVIFDRVGGVQFTPVANGTVYDEPTKSSVIAAKLVLDGANTAANSLFFLNQAIAASKWILRTRTFVSSIGNHDFYA
ncbi:MAG: cell wall hydrolase [Oscillospiraceae bacterium]|jgi:N-acetylmuramoyl-L-alanine amidase|nr:cell wall hydrolase [Oscillospiraceae bacterium]